MELSPEMNSKYRTRSAYGERLEIALTAEQKQRAFDIADRQNISVGALLRRAIDAVASEQKAA